MKSLIICTAFVGLSAACSFAQPVVRYPLGGEQLTAGQDRTILWDKSTTATPVTISLWNGTTGTWSSIASAAPSGSGRYLWHVPANLHGDKFRIKITSERISDLTPTFFSIAEAQKPVGKQSRPQSVSQAVSVNPNPATMRADVIWGGGAKLVELVDILGNVLTSVHVSESTISTTLQVTNVPSGTYFVRISYLNGSVETRKIVKE